jgi:diguanylate cyclase (GGDEF)-like protein
VRRRRWSHESATQAVALTLALAYAVSLVPGVRRTTGYVPLIDGWLNNVTDTALIALVLRRAWRDTRERVAWACLTAALLCALASSISYFAYYQFLDPVPSPSWADLGWLFFYLLSYVAIVLLLRGRVGRLLPSIWLDGLIGGVTAAALAAAFLPGAAVPPAAGTVLGIAATVAYPVADLLLLVLVVAAITILGRHADATWWLLCTGFFILVVTDAIYAQQVAAGTYVIGQPLDLGWLLPRVCFAAAAILPVRRRARVEPDRIAVLAVPAVCALAILGLLFYATITELPRDATVLALAAGLGVIARTVLTFREVRAAAEMRRQARTDDLTGLANRRAFYEALDQAIRRVGPTGSLAVLLVDLDQFKEVNDSLGHHTGDELLQVVAGRLQTLVRGDDVLARLGGDEYALLLHHVTAPGTEALAQRLRARLRDPVQLGAASLTADASVGVALAPAHASTATGLLQRADLAMYGAKRQRIGVALYDETRDGEGLHRLELAAQLRRGIDQGELVLHYQPKLDLRRNAVTGVEALVRWQHPTRGVLMPHAFVPLAQSSGLMTSLTSSVLGLALAQCARWRHSGLNLSVAVNVSPSDLLANNLSRQVDALLAAHRLPPEALTIEVTEDILVQARDRAVAVLAGLRELGVGVAIDDYGTGYASLAYLSDLPATELKLDRTFIASMLASRRVGTIVESTIHLGRSLGLVLVAEGVEDERTLDVLARSGCDLAQGHYIGHPVTAEEIPDIAARPSGSLRAD